MTLHALDVLGDAYTATKEYRPRGLGQWLWVTAVALLVGSTSIGLPSGSGGGGTGGTGTGGPGSGGGEMPGGQPDPFTGVESTVLEFLVVILVVIAAVWLLFLVLGALLEFPFLAWLRDGEAATWREVRAHLGQALGLAAFRAVLSLVGLAITVGAVLAVVGTDGAPMEYLVTAGELSIIFALISLPLGVVQAFTTGFVVPTMALEDRGVLGGWRRVWTPLTDAPKQFLVYAVAVAVLGAVGGLLVLLAAFIAMIPALIVGGVLGLIVAVAVAPIGGVVVVALFGGLAFTAVALTGFALLKVYLRYYALFVLARIDGDLDFLPERRRAVGADLDEDAGDGGGGPAAGTADGTDGASGPDETPGSGRGRDDPQLDPV